MYNRDNMSLLKSVGEFFALDIGTKAIRVVQLSGSKDKWSLAHYGYASVEEKITAASDEESRRRLSEVIMTAVGQSGIKVRNVVVGIPSQKSFTTVIDMPMMSDNELRSTIKYQIDKYIPMSIEDAKVDWAQLGQSMHDPKLQEVLLASVANDYVEERLDFIEALGLNVIALEPEPIALVRSLLPAGTNDARMILDVGELATNLVITYNDAPRLVRTIPTGLSTLIKSAAQNLNVQEDQARQFLLKFGLASDRLEGQVYRAVEASLESFVSEIVKSVKFFQTRTPNTPVGGVLLAGFASSVPQFGEYISAKTNIPAQHANPWQKVTVSQNDQQQIATVGAEFAVAVGLAQRSGE
jgi:type IV pilus assembly protein PilM